MLGCDEVGRDLSGLLDGDVPFLRRTGIYVHLAMCNVCSAVYASLRETVGVLHALRDEPLPGPKS